VARSASVRPFLALFGTGLAGTLALYASLKPIIEGLPPHVRGGLSVEAITALSLIQPALLLLVGVTAGVLLAPRVGLRSRIAAWANDEEGAWIGLRQDLIAGLLGAVASVALVVVLDLLLTGSELQRLQLLRPRPLAMVLSAVLYGGTTEELMMRYGGMTLLAWLLWRVTGGREAGPGQVVFWISLLVMALVFGAGHLGTAALGGPLTPFVVLRTVLLNSVAGAIYGWLYWRHSLESAMLAHGGFHVVLAVLATLVHPS
jgi:CAAX amino terminal protease family.